MKRSNIQGSSFALSIGIVKNNSDPIQHGRLQVWLPAVDSVDFKTDDLPWALYVSPFGGSTANLKVGREQEPVPGVSTYGLWAIPKNGAQVIVGCLEGEPMKRFWFGCVYQPELNRTLPHSVDGLKTELDESGVYPQSEIPYLKANLEEAGLGPSSTAWRTVGGYERSVSYPANKTRDKPTDNGYAKKPMQPELADSQLYSLTTPGRHYILLSDVDEYCRIRLRTTAGSQVIFDDTNERIYISTARGRGWIELDEGSGHVSVYAAGKVNVHAENDINLCSEENVNIVARKRVNIESQERGVRLQARLGVDVLSREGDVKVTASRDLHLRTLGGPTGAAVPERTACHPPPYAGGPLGLTRDHPEAAGSSTSRILLNAVENVEVRSDTQSLKLTGALKVDVLAVGADLTLQGSSGLNLKADKIATFAASIGLKAVDYDQAVPNLNAIISSEDFGGTVEVASPAAQVTPEDVRARMLVPEHEPWDRRTDDGACPTPRNKSYRG